MTLQDDIKLKLHDVIYKGVKHAGTLIAGVVAMQAVKHFGITITDAQKLEIAGGVAFALGAFANILKQKFPGQLGWL